MWCELAEAHQAEPVRRLSLLRSSEMRQGMWAAAEAAAHCSQPVLADLVADVRSRALARVLVVSRVGRHRDRCRSGRRLAVRQSRRRDGRTVDVEPCSLTTDDARVAVDSVAVS